MKTVQERTFDLLEQTGLNWTVSKEALVSASGKPTNSFGIFRNDSGAHMGTFNGWYTPYQNFELAETIIQATDSVNIETTSGGSLKGGKKVYLQAALPDEYIGKSPVKRWITALNSHDGSTSIAFGSSSTVVVCQNTFFRAYRELNKFLHSATAKERMAQAAIDLRRTLELDEKLMVTFKRFADAPLKDELVERVITKIFEVKGNTQQDEISTLKKKKIQSFADALTTEIKLEGSTVWGLFNGVTRYTNHIAAPKDAGDKLNYIMDGAGYKMSNMVFEDLLQWVEKNTAEYVPMSVN